MKRNITKLRLLGIISFAVFLAISFVRLYKGTDHMNTIAQDWDSKPQNIFILISVLCFAAISFMQIWRLTSKYYIKKEDLSSGQE